MRALRLLIPATLAVALVPLASGPASAAPPGNDEATGAVVLHLGDRVAQDTSEATTNGQDDALNANCGAPATNASVWYQFTPGVNRKVVLDMSESSYSGGLMVFKGTPTPDSLVSCGPGAVGLRAKAGRTYTIMAFSDTEVNGGSLILTMQKAPTPRVRVSVDRRGVAYHGGAARVHGTYFCAHGESFGGLSAQLFQRAGRLKIQAEADMNLRCDAKSHHWSLRLVSPVGTYAQGHAVAKVNVVACGFIECRQDRAKRHVRLTWAAHPQRQGSVQRSTNRTERPRPLIARERHWPGH
jgi:hypothetical protein